jgi:hypothetical protein
LRVLQFETRASRLPRMGEIVSFDRTTDRIDIVTRRAP